MRLLSLSSFVLLVACGASEFQSQKLADGSYTFKCELAMDECIRRAQEQCKNQRYRIIEGTSETRLRDAPPFERAYHTSRIHLMCTDDGANVLLKVGTEASEKPKGAGCSAGETRACVGPGACKGGQACLADGSAFGSCDCGNVSVPAPPAEPASTASPGAAQPANPAEPGRADSGGLPTAPAPPAPPAP